MSSQRAMLANQIRQRVTRVPLGRLIQDGAALLIGRVHIGATGQQKNDDLFPASANRKMPMQRRSAEQIAAVDRSAGIQQPLDHRGMAVFGRDMQRGVAIRGAGVELRARCQEQFDRIEVRITGGTVQNRPAQIVHGIDIRTTVEQKPDDVAVNVLGDLLGLVRLLLHQAMQRCAAIVVDRVGIGAVLEKQSDRFDPAVTNGPVQRRSAAFIAHIDLAKQRQQVTHHLWLSGSCRNVQTGLAIAAAGGHIRAPIQEHPDYVASSLLGRSQQARREVS
jgi:hypothetical protein